MGVDVIRYGGMYNHALVTTTDATPTEIGNVAVDDSNAGFLVIDVQSIVTDGTEFNGGRYAVKYSKVGTLTLGTLASIWEDNTSAISISVAADADENISIVGTGVAATEINWLARTQNLFQQFTDLP